MSTTRKINKWITVSLLVVCTVLGGALYFINNSNQDLKSQITLVKTSLDSTKIKYNKDKGVWESQRKIYQADKDNLVHFLNEKDKQLAELAKKKDIREVIVTKSELRVDTVVDTRIVYVKDTVTGKDIEVRNIALQDSFINLQVKSFPDSSNINLKANTDITLKVQYDGMITATPTSPYLKVNEIKGFNKVEKQKKRGWLYFFGGMLVSGGIIYGVTR